MLSTAMTSPTALQDPDYRTPLVGKKRGLNELSTANDSIATMEEDSSNEDNQSREKRSRYSDGVEADDQQLNSTTESSPDVVVISDSSESASSEEEEGSISSSEDVLTDSSGNVNAGSTVDPPTAWNPGVSVTIRTSLTDGMPQSQFMSTHVGIVPQTFAIPRVDTAATSINATRIVSADKPLDDNESVTVAAMNKHSEEAVNFRSKLELKQEIERLQKIEKALANRMRQAQKEKPRSHEAEAEKETILSKKQAEAQDKKWANILAQLPSSFGSPFCQKEAEKIINGLPEDSKYMMPRDVADAAFNFTMDGRTFKLPQRLHDALPVVHLAKLSFRNPLHSFVGAFLDENQSLLEVIDYDLLVRAFEEYVRLLYGHLPDRLLSLVCSSKHVVGSKSIKACLKLLREARGKLLRERELEEARSAKNKAREAELRRLQGQLAEARKELISVKEADKKAIAEAKKETTREAGDIINKARRAAKEATEAENGNASKESEKYKASEQSESANPELGSTEELTTFCVSRSNEMVQNLQNLKPHSMGRLLGAKRAQSQATLLTTTDSAHDKMDDSSGKKELIRNQQPVLETISGLAHTTDQVDTERQPANIHPISLEVMHRYHPSSVGSPLVRYCLTCAQTDHTASNCPLLTCTSCGLRGVHFTAVCPKRQRCARCHERGHQKSDCLEKLAATADEFPRCDICSSSNHLESSCHFIWRSFKPGMLNTTRFVVDIPIHCYCCGATGHFGSECGIRNSPLFTEGYSWSMSNWKRYVDPQSLNRAISAGKDFSLPLATKAKKSFNIRGSAQSGIVTPMDDDEDIPFIREKVAKPSRPAQRGNQHIKFGHNRPEDNENVHRPHLGPPLPDSRYQPSRVAQPPPQRKPYTEDRHKFYRPHHDSARYMRERSFSPPPRFQEDGYPTKHGDVYHRTEEIFDSYRPRDRIIDSSNIPAKMPVGRDNYNPGLAHEGPAQARHGGAAIPRRQRQRNRKD
jgi:hypothetical protein